MQYKKKLPTNQTKSKLQSRPAMRPGPTKVVAGVLNLEPRRTWFYLCLHSYPSSTPKLQTTTSKSRELQDAGPCPPIVPEVPITDTRPCLPLLPSTATSLSNAFLIDSGSPSTETKPEQPPVPSPTAALPAKNASRPDAPTARPWPSPETPPRLPSGLGVALTPPHLLPNGLCPPSPAGPRAPAPPSAPRGSEGPARPARVLAGCGCPRPAASPTRRLGSQPCRSPPQRPH